MLTNTNGGEKVLEVLERKAMPPASIKAIAASFPVVRRGTLLAARDTANKLIHSFTYDQGELAIDEIERRKDDFHTAIRKGLKAGAAALGFGEAAVLPTPPMTYKTSVAARNQGLGAVYDFDDMALDLHGAWLLLCRVCLTVCVEQDFLSRDPNPDEPSHSKVWVRFILVEQGEGGQRKPAVSVDTKVVETFHEYTDTLAQYVTKNVTPLYREVTSAVANLALKIEKKQTLSFLTVGVDGDAYAGTTASLTQGESLSQLQHRDSLTKYLHHLGTTLLGVDVLADPDVQFLQYRTPRGDCALYIGAFDKAGAAFVGVTDRKDDERVALQSEMRPASLAANHASAGFSMEYGARF